MERIVEAIRPDTSQGEAPEVPKYEESRGPGSTADVDVWTTKEVREVNRSHLNYVIADTRRWEEQAAYYLDTNNQVDAFVKNQGLNFTIPYIHNGQGHSHPQRHEPPGRRPRIDEAAVDVEGIRVDASSATGGSHPIVA